MGRDNDDRDVLSFAPDGDPGAPPDWLTPNEVARITGLRRFDVYRLAHHLEQRGAGADRQYTRKSVDHLMTLYKLPHSIFCPMCPDLSGEELWPFEPAPSAGTAGDWQPVPEAVDPDGDPLQEEL